MKAGMGAKFNCSMESRLPLKRKFLVQSVWDIEHIRDGVVIDHSIEQNTCSDEGLNALLDIMFHGDTQITTWYVEIFESNTTPNGDTTYAVPVYTPSTSYDEATRPAYVEAAASSKVTTNSANKAVFTISATKTIYGAALVGGGSAATTKGDTAGGGKLFAAAKFGAAKSCIDDDILRVTITLTAADA